MTREIVLRALIAVGSARWFPIVCGTLAVVASANSLVLADEARSEQRFSKNQKQETLLVLQNGRVVKGRVNEDANGYLLETPNSRMLIPYEFVLIQADDLKQAHERMSKLYPEQTTATRMALARWCLAQKLYDSAAEELNAALELEPNNTKARRMLKRVKTLSQRKKSKAQTLARRPVQSRDGFQTQKPTSLAGLTSKSVHQFTTRIQPFLWSRCGNARCHGRAGDNGFRLTKVRSGRGTRRASLEHNITEMMKFIDTLNPGESPLLRVPQGSHGRGGRAIFVTQKDDELLLTLERWVKQVSEETTRVDNSSKSEKRSLLQRANISGQPETTGYYPSGVSLAAGEMEKRPIQIPATKTEAGAKTNHAAGPDLFDPEIFNRTVFSGSRSNR